MEPPVDYEIGYGRPPVHTRFRPGQSGNPKGRRCRNAEATSLHDAVVDELNTYVTVTEGGRQRKVKKSEILVKTMIKLAIEGKRHALDFLREMTNGFDPKCFGAPPLGLRMNSEARKLIEIVEEDVREIEGRREAATSRREAIEPDH